MLGKEVLYVTKNLSRLMAEKIEETISHVHGWVNVWIVFAVARSYSHMIHIDFLHSTLWDQEPNWDPISGLGLTQ